MPSSLSTFKSKLVEAVLAPIYLKLSWKMEFQELD